MVGIILICTINLNVKPFIRMTAGCGLKLLVTILLMLVFVTLQIGGPIIESLQSFIIINICCAKNKDMSRQIYDYLEGAKNSTSNASESTF